MKTGEVVDAADGIIPQEEVYQASSEYTAAYVSPYGDMADIEGRPAGQAYYMFVQIHKSIDNLYKNATMYS